MIVNNPHATVKSSTFAKKMHPKISISIENKIKLDKNAYNHLLNDYIDLKDKNDA